MLLALQYLELETHDLQSLSIMRPALTVSIGSKLNVLCIYLNLDKPSSCEIQKGLRTE